jgi:hypothetical protein
VQLSLWRRVLAKIRVLSQHACLKAILAAKPFSFLQPSFIGGLYRITAFHPQGRCLWASITLLLPPYHPQSPTPSAGTASAWLQLWEPLAHAPHPSTELPLHSHHIFIRLPSKHANFRVTEQHKDEELHFRAVSSISDFESEPWLTRLFAERSPSGSSTSELHTANQSPESC